MNKARWSDSRSTSSSSGTVRGGSGGSYFIGGDGGWGYSSGSGDGSWNPASPGWSLTNPESAPNGRQNPDRQLNYLEALDVILSTSIDGDLGNAIALKPIHQIIQLRKV